MGYAAKICAKRQGMIQTSIPFRGRHVLQLQPGSGATVTIRQFQSPFGEDMSCNNANHHTRARCTHSFNPLSGKTCLATHPNFNPHNHWLKRVCFRDDKNNVVFKNFSTITWQHQKFPFLHQHPTNPLIYSVFSLA